MADAKLLITLGDSKTWGYPSGPPGTWQPALVASLNTADGGNWTAYDGGRNAAALTITPGNAGFAVDYMVYADSYLGAIPATPFKRAVVLINFGANDFCCGMPDQTTWQNKLIDLIDRVNDRWPDCEVYVDIAWSQGHDTQANTMAGWIGNVIAARPRTQIGLDERTWLKGSDNGATNTIDGTHYSTAGNTAKVTLDQALILP